MADDILNSSETQGGTEDINVVTPLPNAEDTVKQPPIKPEGVKMQQGQKFKRDSWLNRNIQSILAILVLVFAFIFFKYVLGFNFTKDNQLKDIVILLIGTVSTLVTVVISYFFGSSQGSSEKSKHMMNGKNNPQ